METTPQGQTGLDALLTEYDVPPQHLLRKKKTTSRLQQTEDKVTPNVSQRENDFPTDLVQQREHPRAEAYKVNEDDSEMLTEEETRVLKEDTCWRGDIDADVGGRAAISLDAETAGELTELPDILEASLEEGVMEEEFNEENGGVTEERGPEVFAEDEPPDIADTAPVAEMFGEDEEEEEIPEMTQDEKKAMSDAVCDGNIDLLDDLLDLPGADINMEWFGENLLMAAIRNDEPDMAIFLLDNGINQNYESARLMKDDSEFRMMLRMDHDNFTLLLDLVTPYIQKMDTNCRMAITAAERLSVTLKYMATGETQTSVGRQYRVSRPVVGRIIRETTVAIYEILRDEYLRHLKNPSTGEMEWYTVSCRQMAYESGMDDVVSVIDEVNDNKWPFLPEVARDKRIKKPLAEKLREKHEAAEAERRRRDEMHAKYTNRRRPSMQEGAAGPPEGDGAPDTASVTSRASHNSSLDSRGERKRRQSKAGIEGALLEEGPTVDGVPLAEGEEGEEEEEEETGPFFVPLGPTHMFPYPTEEEPPITTPHHFYRANRTFISRRDSNTQKLRSAMSSVTGSGAATPVDRSPSVGSYRAESLLWTPSATPSQETPVPSLYHNHPHMALRGNNGRHSSFSTRLISPWKDDDPEAVAAMQKRSKSASTSGGGVVRLTTSGSGSSARNMLNGISSSSASSAHSSAVRRGGSKSNRPLFPLLNAMPQLTALSAGGHGTVIPRRDNFMAAPRTSSSLLTGLVGHATRHINGQILRKDVIIPPAQSEGAAEERVLIASTHQQQALSAPQTSMATYKDPATSALTENAADSRTPSGRSRHNARSHSPAGYLRAFSAGRRQPGPIIPTVVVGPT